MEALLRRKYMFEMVTDYTEMKRLAWKALPAMGILFMAFFGLLILVGADEATLLSTAIILGIVFLSSILSVFSSEIPQKVSIDGDFLRISLKNRDNGSAHNLRDIKEVKSTRWSKKQASVLVIMKGTPILSFSTYRFRKNDLRRFLKELSSVSEKYGFGVKDAAGLLNLSDSSPTGIGSEVKAGEDLPYRVL